MATMRLFKQKTAFVTVLMLSAVTIFLKQLRLTQQTNMLFLQVSKFWLFLKGVRKKRDHDLTDRW